MLFFVRSFNLTSTSFTKEVDGCAVTGIGSFLRRRHLGRIFPGRLQRGNLRPPRGLVRSCVSDMRRLSRAKQVNGVGD